MISAAAGRVALGLLVAGILAAPLFGAYYLTFVFTILTGYIVAQSWDWLHGEAGYVNLGHYIYFGMGAYVFSIGIVNGVPIPLCFLFAVLFNGFAGAALSVPLFRLKGDYFAFATLALLPLAELLSSNLVSVTNGVDGIPLPPAGAIVMGIDVKYFSYYAAFAVAAAAFFISIWINRIPFGYALKGIRTDEQAAETCGVRIWPAKLRVMVLSAMVASLAGCAYAWSFRYIDPLTVFGLNVALIPVAMALLGGSGLLWGPLIGALLLASATQLLLVQMQMLQFTVIGLLILLIGRFMPGGLLRSRAVANVPLLRPLGYEHHQRLTVDLPPRTTTVEHVPLNRGSVDRDKTILQCRDVTMAFGGNVAVDAVNIDIRQGEIVGLIGPNGSGKTTLFNCISKVYEPVAGDIVFDGQSLLQLRRDAVSHHGIGRTYQIPRPFRDLTVQENVAIPLMFRAEGGLGLREALVQAGEFAAYAGLEQRLNDRADALNLQQRKALEFARALACRPRLLLVDEVASGLTPAEVRRFVEHIRDVRDSYGITVIWVEHIISALTQVVDRLIVMEQGAILADGAIDDVMRDERVLTTYFGQKAAAGGSIA